MVRVEIDVHLPKLNSWAQQKGVVVSNFQGNKYDTSVIACMCYRNENMSSEKPIIIIPLLL